MELTFNPNASPKAIEAAKKLIKRYNEITIEEAERALNESHWPARILTGCGNPNTCYLCRATDLECSECIYADLHSAGVMCGDGNNYKTFIAMKKAKTPEELITAFRNRAAHITKIVELIEKNQANGTANS